VYKNKLCKNCSSSERDIGIGIIFLRINQRNMTITRKTHNLYNDILMVTGEEVHKMYVDISWQMEHLSEWRCELPADGLWRG
jgi:hypothetical protein